jgi:hypothetical protein
VRQLPPPILISSSKTRHSTTDRFQHSFTQYNEKSSYIKFDLI